MSEAAGATPAPSGTGAPSTAPAIPTAPATPAAQASPTKYAGRYDKREEFHKGLGELHKQVTGEDAPAVIVGPGGLVSSDVVGERLYKAYQREFNEKQGRAKPDGAAASASSTTVAPIQVGAPAAPAGSEPDLDTDYDIGKLVTDAGVKMDDLEKHWAEHGDLSDEQYVKLRGQRKNLGKADLRLIVAGIAATRENQNTKTQARNTRIEEMLGGGEKAKQIIAWAQTGLDAGRAAAINEMLAKDTHVEYGVKAILDEYVKTNGQPSSAVRGGPAADSGMPGTRNEAQEVFRAAMKGDATAVAKLKKLNPAVFQP